MVPRPFCSGLTVSHYQAPRLWGLELMLAAVRRFVLVDGNLHFPQPPPWTPLTVPPASLTHTWWSVLCSRVEGTLCRSLTSCCVSSGLSLPTLAAPCSAHLICFSFVGMAVLAARVHHLETCMWSSLFIASGPKNLVPVSPSWSQAGASSILSYLKL